MRKLLIATVMSVAATGSAFAETGFYAGVEGGFTFFEDTTDENAAYYINELGASTAQVKEDSAAFPIRPFAGYELNENIAFELGVSFFSRDITAEGTSGSSTYKDTYEQSWRIVDFSVLLRPAAAGFFGRVGGHSTTFDVDYQRVGTGTVDDDSSSDSESKSGLLLGVGYDWQIGPGALRASFTHYSNMPGYEDEYLNLLKVGYLFKF